MPSAALRDILDEFGDQIRGVYASITDLDIQVEPRLLPNPTPPAIDIYPADLGRDTETAGFGDLAGAYLLTVRARVGTNDYDSTQDILVDMMDDQHDLSLLAAVCDDQTLNGLAATVDPRDHSGFQVYQDLSGVGAYVGFQFNVLVIAGES